MKCRKICREPAVQGRKPRIKSTIGNIRQEKAFNQNSKKKNEIK